MATLGSSYPNFSPSAPSTTTSTDDGYCTLSTCSLSLAYIQYVPSLAGNVLYACLFGLFLIGQAILGIRHRTWGFLVGMIGGTVLEVVGYIARILMHYDPFLRNSFLIYLITLTLAPALVSASIYLTLARIIPLYSSSTTSTRFKPRTYTLLFMTFDLIALILQALGGPIASLAPDDEQKTQLGVDIMIAGVSWQVFSLAVFAILCAEFAFRIRKAAEHDLSREAAFVELRHSKQFQWFLKALALATLAIFVRSVFRCAELQGGFKGKLANDEITFMVLEGAMIVIAVGLLTFAHPGLVFKGTWQAAGWSLRGRKVHGGKAIDGNGEKPAWSTPYGNEKPDVRQKSREPPKRPQRPLDKTRGMYGA